MRSLIIGCSSGNKVQLSNENPQDSIGAVMLEEIIVVMYGICGDIGGGGLTEVLLEAIISSNIQHHGWCCSREALRCHGHRVVVCFLCSSTKVAWM